MRPPAKGFSSAKRTTLAARWGALRANTAPAIAAVAATAVSTWPLPCVCVPLLAPLPRKVALWAEAPAGAAGVKNA
eukprot:Skav211138  [mRNA]  locus=scaffold4091:167721:170799:- [translate_table: standard]